MTSESSWLTAKVNRVSEGVGSIGRALFQREVDDLLQKNLPKNRKINLTK